MGSTLVRSSLACKILTRVEVTVENTPAYYNTTTITTVKKFYRSPYRFLSWTQFYKTFYDRNLLMLHIKL